METLFSEEDCVQFDGNPHLYDYYLHLVLEKDYTFEMSFGSNQSTHFIYAGTFEVKNNKITFCFKKSLPCHVFSEKDLLNVSPMNYKHEVTFKIIDEEVLHDFPYGKRKSVRTIKFNQSPFIDTLLIGGQHAYKTSDLPNVLYVIDKQHRYA